MEEDLKEKVHRFIDDIEECGLSDCACSMKDKDSQCEMLRNYITNLEKENTRLKYQDIPYLEGTIKGYKDRVEELKQEITVLQNTKDTCPSYPTSGIKCALKIDVLEEE